MLGEGTIGGGWCTKVVAMAVAIEEGTCKRVRLVKTAIVVWGASVGDRKKVVKMVICSARTSHEPIFIVEAASSMLVSKEIFFDRVARTHSSVVRSRAKLSLHRGSQILQRTAGSVLCSTFQPIS